MNEALHITVKGRVQGVGFRYFTERTASNLGVAGWVKNLPGGDVEVLARIPAGIKEPFLAALREGPPGARVERLNFHPSDRAPPCPSSGFTVRY